MSRLRYNRKAAVSHLCQQCETLGAFIQRHGAFRLKVANDPDAFTALSRAIIYQQLSGKAAGTIYGRFTRLFDDDTPTALALNQLDTDTLRSVGLSRNKALAVQDLAVKSLDGTVPRIRQLSRFDDDEVIRRLVQVRGIGPWTAQMFMMFNLGRPDIMPSADLGVQKGVQAIYELKKLPSPEQVTRRTRHLAPYRSVASWYFWRAADTVLMS